MCGEKEKEINTRALACRASTEIFESDSNPCRHAVPFAVYFCYVSFFRVTRRNKFPL
jgi:hypothetical protein